ncbi:MAG: 2-dehydro-3-deoxy-6-phosphogalactonate aldolase [Bdellovibrionales bacterium]|nr:2-dehydro-3-deoxy-6-phosphogalactonate aldolase [Bdellovibrionales bacterium]
MNTSIKGIIAILRGISPDQVLDVADILIGEGITCMEIPMNSPRVFESLELLCKEKSDVAQIGAGTVTSKDQLNQTIQTGASFVVSPNTNADLIAYAVEQKIRPLPGVFTISEAFEAMQAGAQDLKLFPAHILGPTIIKDWRSVLPKNIGIFPVGGIDASNFADFAQQDIQGVGLGSSLYHPSFELSQIKEQGKKFVQMSQGLFS